MAAKFVIRKNPEGLYRFRLKSEKGDVLASSQNPFPSLQACNDGIEAMKQAAASAKIVDRSEAPADAADSTD